MSATLDSNKGKNLTGQRPVETPSRFGIGTRPMPLPPANSSLTYRDSVTPESAVEPQTLQQMKEEFVQIFLENRRIEIKAMQKLFAEHITNKTGSQFSKIRKDLEKNQTGRSYITKLEKSEQLDIPSYQEVLKAYGSYIDKVLAANPADFKALLDQHRTNSQALRTQVENNPAFLLQLLTEKNRFFADISTYQANVTPPSSPANPPGSQSKDPPAEIREKTETSAGVQGDDNKSAEKPAQTNNRESKGVSVKSPSKSKSARTDPKPKINLPSVMISLGDEGYQIPEANLLKVFDALVNNGQWEDKWGPANLAMPGRLYPQQILAINQLRERQGLQTVSTQPVNYAQLFDGLATALEHRESGNPVDEAVDTEKTAAKTSTRPKGGNDASQPPQSNVTERISRPTPAPSLSPPAPPPLLASSDLAARIESRELHNQALPLLNGKSILNIPPNRRTEFAESVMASSLGTPVSSKTTKDVNSNVWRAFWQVVDAIKAEDPNHSKIPAERLPTILAIMLQESQMGTIGNYAQAEADTWKSYAKKVPELGDVPNRDNPFKAALFINAYYDDVVKMVNATDRQFNQLTDPEKLAAFATAYNAGDGAFLKAYKNSQFKTVLLPPGGVRLRMTGDLKNHNLEKFDICRQHTEATISFTWAIRRALGTFR